MSRRGCAVLALVATSCALDARDLSPEALECGWHLAHELTASPPEVVSRDRRSFVAPLGECVLIRAAAGDLLAPVNTAPCDVDAEGFSCIVLAPGKSIALFTELGVTSLDDGDVEVAPADACALSCAR